MPATKSAYKHIIENEKIIADKIIESFFLLKKNEVRSIAEPFSDQVSTDYQDIIERIAIDEEISIGEIEKTLDLDSRADNIFDYEKSGTEQAKELVDCALDAVKYEGSRFKFYQVFNNIYTQMKQVRKSLDAGEYQEALRKFESIENSYQPTKTEESKEKTFRDVAMQYLETVHPREPNPRKKGFYIYENDAGKGGDAWRYIQALFDLGLGDIVWDDIKPKDFEDAFKVLSFLPMDKADGLDREYEYEGLSLKDRISKVKEVEKRLAEAGTDIDQKFDIDRVLYKTSNMKKYRQGLNRLIKHVYGEVEGSTLVNASNAFKFPRRYATRLPFDMNESKKIIQYLLNHESEDFKFFGLILTYTGMRPSEVRKLKASSLKEKDGIYYLENRGGKSVNATREIPLHQKLIEAGLVDFAKSKTDLLITVSDTTLQRNWDTLHADLNIPKISGEKIKTMYSTRTSFNSRLEGLGIREDVRRLLMGHSMAGAQSSYSKQRDQDFPQYLRNAKEAIDKLDF
ncbi:MAG: hypothetical protein ACTJHE_10500 [Vibrio casei]